jgi:ABC-type amino acid transport substrate-binding protein
MFAVGVTPARAEKLRFSRPYLQSDIYAITTRTNRRIRDWDDIDKPGVVVAVARGTLHEPVMREKLKSATLAVLDTPFAREREVESGRADVFMSDYPYSQRMLRSSDWARLVAPHGVYHLTPYAYAIAPGDERWLARLDRFVADIKRDGRLLAAARRHRLEAIAILDR